MNVIPKLPDNAAGELQLITAMLCDNRNIDKAADIVRPDDFAVPLYGRLFDAIVQVYGSGKAVTPVTLAPLFQADEEFQSLGGAGYLVDQTGSVLLTPVTALAKQLVDLSQRRRLMVGLIEAMDMAANPSEPLADIIDIAEGAITSSAVEHDDIHQPTGAQCLTDYVESLKNNERGVLCRRISNLDQLTGGLKRKQMVIMAGRPGMGKTAVAISYSVGAAMNGHGVLFVSLEMSSVELGGRILADMSCEAYEGEVQSGILYDDLVRRNMDRDKVREIEQSRAIMEKLPIQIVDASRMTIGRLAMMVRRYCRRFEARGQSLDLVVVDYLQLLTPSGRGKSAYESVSEISRELKVIAKENNVTVMALAQLSREVEKRPDKRPQLSDLRDSGQIEQDADTVLFLLRQEYYLNQDDDEEKQKDAWQAAMQQYRSRIEFICAKRRDGQAGSSLGYFYGAYQAVRGAA